MGKDICTSYSNLSYTITAHSLEKVIVFAVSKIIHAFDIVVNC